MKIMPKNMVTDVCKDVVTFLYELDWIFNHYGINMEINHI